MTNVHADDAPQLVREDHRLRIRAACDRIAELKGADHLSNVADQLVREMVEGLELELRSAEAAGTSSCLARVCARLELLRVPDPTSWPPIDDAHGT
jgi:hypothetical protein